MRKKYRLQALTVFFLIFFFNTKAQDGENPKAQEDKSQEETLVEYLTVLNLEIETIFIKEYCKCENKSEFVTNYQNVAKELNKTINKHVSKLSTQKAKKAIDHFNVINEQYYKKEEWKKIIKVFKDFKKNNCPPLKKGFLPAAVTIAEITGVANSIIGLINGGKDRRNAQRDKLITILEGYRIPSIQVYMKAYECEEKKE